MEYPKQRHFKCEDDRCKICLEDSFKLADFLDEKTGTMKIDHLGKYRSFLDNRGIPAETEWGWFTEDVFKKENIDAYIKDQTEEIKENNLDNYIHLCDFCKNNFESCKAKYILFGIDIDKNAVGEQADKVINCSNFEK
jgi:hypothetical protein